MCNIIVCMAKQLTTQRMLRFEEIEARLEMCEECVRKKSSHFIKERTYKQIRHHYTKSFWKRVYGA